MVQTAAKHIKPSQYDIVAVLVQKASLSPVDDRCTDAPLLSLFGLGDERGDVARNRFVVVPLLV